MDKLPERWLECPRRGQLIAGKFLPFKTPLDEKFNDSIPITHRWNYEVLHTYLASFNAKMGMVVDLAFTERFYSGPAVAEKFNLKYVKLKCRGHDQPPTENETSAFIGLVDNFFHDPTRTNQIVGVHCTHGFNRTGFLICAYLVETVLWPVENAVDVFTKARPPGIYKQDYLDELFRRYGADEDVPTAPTLPDWCFAETTADGGVGGKKRRLSGSWNQRAEVKTGVFGVPELASRGVYAISDYEVARKVQRRCQELVSWNRDEFPGQQPVSMDVDNIHHLNKAVYMVSWKADGTRYLMLIDGERETYMLDRDNCVFHVPDLKFPVRRRSGALEDLQGTLVDGELVVDKVPDRNDRNIFHTYYNFLIYDIVRVEGRDVCNADFLVRHQCIQNKIIGPRRELKDRSSEPFNIQEKQFWPIEAVEKIFQPRFRQSVTHEIDGLIFQPLADPYKGGRAYSVLKWKPPDQNTVDFLLRITKDVATEGKLPEVRGLLYVGGNKCVAEIDVRGPNKELRRYDGKIIECAFDEKNSRWKFLRERTDKSFPNAYQTAMGVVKSIKHPIVQETLVKYVKEHARRQSRHPPNQNPPASSQPANSNPPSNPSPFRVPSVPAAKPYNPGAPAGRALESSDKG